MTLSFKKISFLLIIVCFISVQVFAQNNSRHQIVGKWEHISGDWIWFFGDSEIIELRANGTAISFDEYEAGNWTISGQQLTVVDDYGERHVFRFTISGNTLTITDEDGDVGRWRKWSN
ncbi:MAG: lipocalin family protein [Treponema sp.]|nr:lipocalin family protein [Treponema sp.]